MIIGTIVPNNYFMPFESVKCFFQVATKFEIIVVQGPYIYDNRNQLFKIAKKRNESILMIDSDILFKQEDVEKIERHLEKYDIITGVYVLGVPPYPPAILKRINGDYEFCEPPKELSEIDASGGGFLGISKRVMLENPFNDVWEGKVKHGEDISFCHRARERGYKVWCDPEIKVGQLRVASLYPNMV